MSNSSNKTNIPEAKSAMNKFKMEVANEIGVPLSDGYNGNLTSAQNGSVEIGRASCRDRVSAVV